MTRRNLLANGDRLGSWPRPCENRSELERAVQVRVRADPSRTVSFKSLRRPSAVDQRLMVNPCRAIPCIPLDVSDPGLSKRVRPVRADGRRILGMFSFSVCRRRVATMFCS